MTPDPVAVCEIIREVAAEEIMPRFRHLEPDEIQSKGDPNDLVTVADEAAERALTERLTALLPGSEVVGEEGSHADPSRLELLLGDKPVWIIDPVDGTANFAAGREKFGVLVALARGGRTRQGYLYDPVTDLMILAEEGSGAFHGATRLHVPAPPVLADMIGFSPPRYRKPLRERVQAVVEHGSAAQDYLSAATGKLHFSWYRRLNPWDHAPGALVHTEAGGYQSLLTGEPYRPVQGLRDLLLAPDPESWHMLREVMIGLIRAHNPNDPILQRAAG